LSVYGEVARNAHGIGFEVVYVSELLALLP
jgi:hypothetical protein